MWSFLDPKWHPVWVIAQYGRGRVAMQMAVDMHETFQRDDEIDEMNRSSFARKIRSEPQSYSLDETNMIASVTEQLSELVQEDSFRWGGVERALVESPDPFVAMGVQLKNKAHDTRMRASVVIDAPVEEVAA